MSMQINHIKKGLEYFKSHNYLILGSSLAVIVVLVGIGSYLGLHALKSTPANAAQAQIPTVPVACTYMDDKGSVFEVASSTASLESGPVGTQSVLLMRNVFKDQDKYAQFCTVYAAGTKGIVINNPETTNIPTENVNYVLLPLPVQNTETN